MDNRPIGFMDSGVGGLSVVKAAQQILPNEEILFIGDEARMPYGPRSTKEVVEFSRQMATFLVSQNVKALVIACNTATNAALEVLQSELSIPVIGVIMPGALTASQQTRNQRVGIIATLGTINAEAYPKALAKIDAQIQTYSLACQEFVEIVENNQSDAEMTKQIVQKQLSYFKDLQIDTLILGCTHFPLLSDSIQQAVGTEVGLIDPGAETVNQLKQILQEQGLLHDEEAKKDDRYYTTGNLTQFQTIAETFLEQDLKIQQIEIK